MTLPHDLAETPVSNTRHPMQVTVACRNGIDAYRLAGVLRAYEGATGVVVGQGLALNGIPENTLVIETSKDQEV